MRFLEGADASPLETLQRAMQEASAVEAFERAAALRDRWQPMHWLRRSPGARPPGVPAVVRLPGRRRDGSRGHWYVIHHGRVRAVTPAPRDEANCACAALAALEAAFHDGESGPPGPDEIDGVLLVAAWFRRHPAEKDKALTLAAARTACAAT